MMFLIIHVLLGALIGLNINSIPLIILLSILGHFILDMIPHWDNHFDNKVFKTFLHAKINKWMVFIVVVDVFLSVLIISFLYQRFENGLMILGGLVSMAPDILKLGYFTKLMRKNKYRKYLLFHSIIQKETNWKLGLLTQAVTGIIFLKLLF